MTSRSGRPRPGSGPRSGSDAARALDDANSLVARRIAALRREAGLTLRELAGRVGLSDAYLSRVENGRSAVTIRTLALLAGVFGTPVSAFFGPLERPAPLVLCRAGTGRRCRFRGSAGSRAELLAEGKPHKQMEPLIVEVGSARTPVAPTGHAGEEFNLVLSGRCRLLYGTETHDLGPGDSVYFDAAVPHAVHPLDDEPCRLLAVVTSPEQSAHADVVKIVEGRIQA